MTQGTENHAYTRRKRELALLIKRSAAESEECPCALDEERNACGDCKTKGEVNTEKGSFS